MAFYTWVPYTWAYQQAQLDFPPYKRRRVHVLDEYLNWGERTLCGLFTTGGEWGDKVTEMDGKDYQCKRCVAALRERMQRGK